MKRVKFKNFEINYEKPVDDQFCNVCLVRKKLSWDHVPPKGVVGNDAVVIDSLASRLVTGKPFQHTLISQNGVKFKTICSDCNNRLKRGDNFLKRFAEQVKSIIESKIYITRPIMVTMVPNIIIRSILGHIIAANTNKDKSNFDEIVRPCLNNFSVPIPSDIHIFFWIYPFRTIKIMRDFLMPTVRGKFNSFSIFQLLKFYPLAFLVSDTPNYQGLFSLDKFRTVSLEETVEIKLHVDGLPIKDWPEVVDNGNIITFGRAGIEALIAKRK